VVAAFEDATVAIGRVRDGDTIMCGGFGPAGAPERLIDALLRCGRRDLTVISNNLSAPGKGLGVLLRQERLRRAIGSFFTGNPEVVPGKSSSPRPTAIRRAAPSSCRNARTH
jgi:acyl CoA:acetate/3-ketoacid CoA transferase alpha subunit